MTEAAEVSLQTVAEPALIEAGIIAGDSHSVWHPLSGGVSSDLWIVSVGGRSICVVKAALEQLKVDDVWKVPLDRNANECRWLRMVHDILPHAVPSVLYDDSVVGFFAMEYLEPESHPVWKN